MLEIGGVSVRPGEQARVELPVADLPSGAALSIPVRVYCGRRAGPTLFVSAAVHGDEVNGVEILRRVLRQTKLRRLRGTLLAVPVVNVFGFASQSRYLPDRRDLNRCFPGSETGSLGSRLAHIFIRDVVAHATHGIDLHTGSVLRTNLPQLRVTRGHPRSLTLAREFGAPVVIEAPVRDGSLRAAAAAADIPMLVYEGGEANRFDEWAIRAGVRGVLRVMRALEMLPPRKRAVPVPEPVVCSSSTWVRAPESGIFRPQRPLGSTVAVGDVLGTVADAFGDHEVEVSATVKGVVVGRSNHPLVHEGDALYHLARLDGSQGPELPLEDFQVDLRQPFLVGGEDDE